MGGVRRLRDVSGRQGAAFHIPEAGTMTLPPVVVFLLAAAIIAGSLSWPAVAGAAYGVALLLELAHIGNEMPKKPDPPPSDDD